MVHEAATGATPSGAVAFRHAPVDAAGARRTGERMRVHVLYDTEWFGYFMRRLAEPAANVAFFLRSLVTRN
jgi:proline dehydrogenase